MPSACRALLITVGTLLSACGSATLDESVAALQDSYNGKSYDKVVVEAGELLQRCDQEQAALSTIWRLERLRLQALGKLGRGVEALSELQRLQADYPDKVNAKLYGLVGGMVTEAGQYQEAIDILDRGRKTFPEMADRLAPQIEDLKRRVEQDGSDADREKLAQLGYL